MKLSHLTAARKIQALADHVKEFISKAQYEANDESSSSDTFVDAVTVDSSPPLRWIPKRRIARPRGRFAKRGPRAVGKREDEDEEGADDESVCEGLFGADRYAPTTMPSADVEVVVQSRGLFGGAAGAEARAEATFGFGESPPSSSRFARSCFLPRPHIRFDADSAGHAAPLSTFKPLSPLASTLTSASAFGHDSLFASSSTSSGIASAPSASTSTAAARKGQTRKKKLDVPYSALHQMYQEV
ncbi:hypothetical protein BDK51DRAFT_28834 [Blyttiomyces helicus]|uniref:Uncharacterized protein n=1 Tax=Blyttiomyces helicus TaxID=388810 RepID=A0A4P9WN57_9FUNG|nr:hypothetical protein BDK51DRAFT_28834 [Blyttiomyces helicus]|eukprot:RKO93685.1 hypothetical protein BDK51DRAFT_28834 [Blyttiomyces helicus]